jgi:hypothetical protein
VEIIQLGTNRVVYLILTLCLLVTALVFPDPSESRTTRHRAARHVVHRTATVKHATKTQHSRKSGKKSASTKKTSKSAKTVKASKKHKSAKKVAAKSSSRMRRGTAKTAKARYAYPSDLFMWSAPERMANLSPTAASAVRTAFDTGKAGKYSPAAMVEAGLFSDAAQLRGGIFPRREKVQHIILHSTETESPADAQRVIRSWNHGMRHPGAQYVVDRDGVIYQAVDPAYGAVHVDIFRSQKGINNDNSVGIEIVRAGSQQYTADQLNSVSHLVAYLQDHFGVPDEEIYGHGQIQPSNRRDPLNFDWSRFSSSLASVKSDAQLAVGPKPPKQDPNSNSWFRW